VVDAPGTLGRIRRPPHGACFRRPPSCSSPHRRCRGARPSIVTRRRRHAAATSNRKGSPMSVTRERGSPPRRQVIDFLTRAGTWDGRVSSHDVAHGRSVVATSRRLPDQRVQRPSDLCLRWAVRDSDPRPLARCAAHAPSGRSMETAPVSVRPRPGVASRCPQVLSRPRCDVARPRVPAGTLPSGRTTRASDGCVRGYVGGAPHRRGPAVSWRRAPNGAARSSAEPGPARGRRR
jgi:hypothetical protein